MSNYTNTYFYIVQITQFLKITKISGHGGFTTPECGKWKQED